MNNDEIIQFLSNFNVDIDYCTHKNEEMSCICYSINQYNNNLIEQMIAAAHGIGEDTGPMPDFCFDCDCGYVNCENNQR